MTAAAAAGAYRGAPFWGAVGGTLLFLALGCAALGAVVHDGRALKRGSRPSMRRDTDPNGVQKSFLQRAGGGLLLWGTWTLALGISFLVALDRDAAGHVGLLVTFFLMLPGLSVSRWFPRVAALSWACSTLLLAALSLSSELASMAILTLATAACLPTLAAHRDPIAVEEAPT